MVGIVSVLLTLLSISIGTVQAEIIPRQGEYFTPFHTNDYTEWVMKNAPYHASLFPHTPRGSLTYAFKKLHVPRGCSSIGREWVQQKPNIPGNYSQPPPGTFEEVIYCTWGTGETNNVVAWVKDNMDPGVCLWKQCPYGWEEKGRALAAYYTGLSTGNQLAPEFGKPCYEDGAEDGAPVGTPFCILKERDQSCTYTWKERAKLLREHSLPGILNEYEPNACDYGEALVAENEKGGWNSLPSLCENCDNKKQYGYANDELWKMCRDIDRPENHCDLFELDLNRGCSKCPSRVEPPLPTPENLRDSRKTKPFTPIHMEDHAVWMNEHADYHQSLFNKTYRGRCLTYAFNTSQVSSCSSIGRGWIEQKPNIRGDYAQPLSGTFEHTIYCSWCSDDTRGVFAWAKDNTDPGRCLWKQCLWGWEEIGRAHAAYYTWQSTGNQLAPEFGKPCYENGAPVETPLCLLRDRDKSCTYAWRGVDDEVSGFSHNICEDGEMTVVMNAWDVRREKQPEHGDRLCEKCSMTYTDEYTDKYCEIITRNNNNVPCNLFELYYSYGPKAACRICPNNPLYRTIKTSLT